LDSRAEWKENHKEHKDSTKFTKNSPELRKNPCLPVYQAGGMADRFVTIMVKNKTFISKWFGHDLAKRTYAPAKEVVFKMK